MNQYLIKLLKIIAIDTEHLMTEYLNSDEISYIDEKIKSEQDFRKISYTDEHGANLEVLLFFLTKHNDQVIDFIQKKAPEGMLVDFYTSSVISASYDCFRFDLSKFPHTYSAQGQKIILYRIGRENEDELNLGHSWAMNLSGLKSFYESSGLDKCPIKRIPIFEMEINDSEILFEGKKTECEVVLKLEFQHNKLKKLSDEEKKHIFD